MKNNILSSFFYTCLSFLLVYNNIMAKKRIKIPNITAMRIFYKSAKTCAVCKNNNKPLFIHHIDENPSNNNEENLILICAECHNEAHTKHDYSINLDNKRLLFFKTEWEKEIKEKSINAMIKGDVISPINWTYFNFSIIPKSIISYGIDYKNEKYRYLLESNIINKELEIISKENNKHFDKKTIFDCVNINNAHILKSYFEEQVNNLISVIMPYEIDAIWTKKEIMSLINPNTFVYHNGGMYFKSLYDENGIETRKIHMQAKNIRIEGLIYTYYMFGLSSIINSFKRHSNIIGLYLVKNIICEKKCMTLNVTPIVLGSGNLTYYSQTPFKLRDKRDLSYLTWDNDMDG